MGGGNLKEIRLIIAYQEKKYQEEIDNKAKESIQLQGQENAKLEQMKAQAAQQLKMMEDAEKRNDFTRDILREYYKAFPALAKPLADQVMGVVDIPDATQGGNLPQSPQGGGNVPPEQMMPQNA
jgi:hypothetical protein